MAIDKKIKYIQTDKDASNGVLLCPSCGSSDVTYDIEKQKLKCNYCNYVFEPSKDEELSKSISEIEGDVRGSGTKDIKKNAHKVSMLCSSCGARVIIDMNHSPSQRCHWCHSVLSISKQSNDGTIPDEILPFSVSRDEAVSKITQYIRKKKSLADTTFLENYREDDIVGVYLPYVIFDIKGHSKMDGMGERSFFSIFRIFQLSSDDHIYYDAKLYHLKREFDFHFYELILEANSNYQRNNIIHSIMPFDTENTVKYHSNYLEGYRYEIRNLNIGSIEESFMNQVKGVARYAMQPFIKKYNRGVSWSNEEITVNSQKWRTAYLPVWLYSYHDRKNQLKYIAVNGRTGEVVGSISYQKGLVWFITIFLVLLELGVYLYVYCYRYAYFFGTIFERIFIFLPFLAILTLFLPKIICSIYEKNKVRHAYEKYTKYDLSEVLEKDEFQKKEYGLTDKQIIGRNDN